MINYKIHKNILDLDDLNLESSLSSLTPQDRERIDLVNILQVQEKAYFQRDMLSIFKDFLSFCMEEHNVYLILLEPYPQTKNRIRSKKGLFYNHKSSFGKNTALETETEVVPDETLFAGIIRVTEKNIDYLINRFDDFPFAFGLIAPRGTKTFKNKREDFLKAIVQKGLQPGKIYWKNWLKIAALLVKPGRKFFTLQDLSDTEHFRVFYHKADMQWGNRLESFISQELQNSPLLQN
jgi:hypothetical protein